MLLLIGVWPIKSWFSYIGAYFWSTLLCLHPNQLYQKNLYMSNWYRFEILVYKYNEKIGCFWLARYLLHSPLLTWEGATYNFQRLRNYLPPLVPSNYKICTSILCSINIWQCSNIHKNTSMCILTLEIISNIISPNYMPTKFQPTMYVPSTVYELIILFDIADTTQRNNWWYWRKASENWYPKWTNRFSIWYNEYRQMWVTTWKRIISIPIFI